MLLNIYKPTSFFAKKKKKQFKQLHKRKCVCVCHFISYRYRRQKVRTIIATLKENVRCLDFIISTKLILLILRVSKYFNKEVVSCLFLSSLSCSCTHPNIIAEQEFGGWFGVIPNGGCSV